MTDTVPNPSVDRKPDIPDWEINHRGPIPPARKVLLVGCMGVVGRQLVKRLEDQYELTVADLYAGELGCHTVHALDIRDLDAVAAAIRGHDAVIHAAIASRRAMEHLPEAEGDAMELDINTRGTLNIFQACRQERVPRVVYLSSTTMMMGKVGDPPQYPKQYDMSDKVRPRDMYACTKYFGEVFAEMYARQVGMVCVSLRIGQPCPRVEGMSFDPHPDKDISRGLLVTFDDLARATHASLCYPGGTGEAGGPGDPGARCPVVAAISQNHTPTMTYVPGQQIGYFPEDFIHKDGRIEHVGPAQEEIQAFQQELNA